MKPLRRALLLAPLAGIARAQERPLRLIVPYPPGGASDLLGRLLAELLAAGLHLPAQVENLPGAATVIGARAAAAAPADGSTLLLATSTTLAINPAMQKALAYDPVRDFAPVALVATVPFVLAVRSAGGPADLAGFLALARARPEALTYGTAGPGSPHHLAMVMLASLAGVSLTQVPYRGSAPGLVDLVGGRLDAMMVDLAPALPFLQSGALRVLAVTPAERLAALPEVPTVAEAGLPGYAMGAWQGLVAPAATPSAVVARLAEAVLAGLARPEATRRLAALSLAPQPLGPEAFARFIRAEIARWAPIVQASGATLD